MALKDISLIAIKRAARDLRIAADALDGCVAAMKTEKGEVPYLPLHGLNYVTNLVPQIAEWAPKFKAAVEVGVKNWEDGKVDPDVVDAQSSKPKKAKKG